MDKNRLYRLTSGQHGVFTTGQAAALGIDHRALYRLQSAGEIARIWTGVYRLAGVPRSPFQRAAAAQLWAGRDAAVSHDTAGWLLGLCDRDAEVVHVTTPHRARSPDDRIVVHRRGDLERRDVSRVKAIAVTTMPRTVIDMAAVCSDETVDIALDAAIRQGMSRIRFVRRLDELARPGRNGMALIKRLVAERVMEQGLTESPFERLLLRALSRSGLPLPVCQLHVDNGAFGARVDFAYPDRGLVVEADGYRWHDGRAAWERDRLRIAELAACGWRVLLVTWLQLKYRPAEVIDRIGRALAVTVPGRTPGAQPR